MRLSLVQNLESTWMLLTRTSTLLSKPKSRDSTLTSLLVIVKSKLLHLQRSMRLRWKCAESNLMNAVLRRLRSKEKSLTVRINKTDLFSVSSALLLLSITLTLCLRTEQSLSPKPSALKETSKEPTTNRRTKWSSMSQTDLYLLRKFPRLSSSTCSRSRSSNATLLSSRTLAWTPTTTSLKNNVNFLTLLITMIS